MGTSRDIKKDLEIARRLESRAYNELEYRTQQANEQKQQLESILKYREECREGLANARETGLSPVHVREFQLLMRHIDSVVETIEYKAGITRDNLDRAMEIWQEHNKKYLEAKEILDESRKNMVPADAADADKSDENSNNIDDKEEQSVNSAGSTVKTQVTIRKYYTK